jgi:YHS domain-containing protein
LHSTQGSGKILKVTRTNDLEKWSETMTQPTKLVLTATVTHRKAEKPGKCSKVTLVTIRVNDTIAAGASLGGRRYYTEEEALREFKKNPERFKKHPAYETALAVIKLS